MVGGDSGLTYEALVAAATEAGHGEVAAWAAELDAEGRARLVSSARGFGTREGFAALDRIFKVSTTGGGEAAGAARPWPKGGVAGLQDADAAVRREGWRKRGLEEIRGGRVGVVLLAGGQGTRLGYDGPKGCFDVGLPSGRSLFQLQAERLLRLQRVAEGPPIPWYVMTSDFNHAATEAHFEEAGYFGLDSAQVTFFRQGTLPCFDNAGKLLLEDKSCVALAPDGNGGIYAALKGEGVLADMEARGVQHVHVYCVDNALARPGDPEFVGCCAEAGRGCGATVVKKAFPEEPVGVFAMRGAGADADLPAVVEYSELDPADASRVDLATGEMAFAWANICVHYFSVPFLRDACERLEAEALYHVARKKIPHVDPVSGAQVKPSEPNGIKLEMFIFDVFRLSADGVTLLEVDRAKAFSPVKNAEGKDSPATAREHLLALHASWIQAAGGNVDGPGGAEVAPAASYEGEGLEGLVRGKRIPARSVVG